jgi:hypothetical protein
MSLYQSEFIKPHGQGPSRMKTQDGAQGSQSRVKDIWKETRQELWL